ncbi:hypothetical protein Ssi03_01760 [Sphaerisporangium siamense]|nr:hypothetical protein Ssi03_01760 [Sphaerisporangium siamense]
MPGPARVLTGTATSADRTAIAYDVYGTGPAVILVAGAMMDRAHPTLTGVARALAPWFTVLGYDRRGRGGSGDTAPYAVAREVEDLAAVMAAAGESAMVFGGSSGAARGTRARWCPARCTGSWRARRTTWPSRPSPPNCWSSSPSDPAEGDRPAGRRAGPSPDGTAAARVRRRSRPGARCRGRWCPRW